MTLQDPTPSMGFWGFRDPTVKRGKEMTVRKLSSFLLGRGKTAQDYNAENMSKPNKMEKEKVERQKNSLQFYTIKFTLLNLQLQQQSPPQQTTLIKHLSLNSVTQLCQSASLSFDLKTRPPLLSPAINLYGSD